MKHVLLTTPIVSIHVENVELNISSCNISKCYSAIKSLKSTISLTSSYIFDNVPRDAYNLLEFLESDHVIIDDVTFYNNSVLGKMNSNL